jgi:hypothetical protein
MGVMNKEFHAPEMTPARLPLAEQMPGTLDMTVEEARFGVPSTEAQIDMIGMDIAAGHAEDEMTPVVGFNQDLMMMYLRAAPGSEFAKNLEKAMMVDFVVNNAVAYNLMSSPYEQAIIEKEEGKKKKKETVNA